ncbi:guanylate kinase [Binucleata daphniae]
MYDQRHIIISGPSGCGKSTLAHALIDSNNCFKFAVSHTTRPIRPFEVHGVDYFFVTKAHFEDMIRSDGFLEYTIYNGHYYGTSYEQFTKSKKILILDIERNGVLRLKKEGYEFRYIFVYCKKTQVLERLVGRTEINGRINLENLLEISNRINEYDKDFQVYMDRVYDIGIENDDVNIAFEKIEQFLYANEVFDVNDEEITEKDE